MKKLFEQPTQDSGKDAVSPIVPKAALSETASLDMHVKLQLHQEEFLAWLESQENKGQSGSSFRKIR